MNVVIAPDAYKDCLTASEVAEAMKKGVLSFDKAARCFTIRASDGGEGFLNAVATYISEVKKITAPTVDPLGRDINAIFLYDELTRTAYIELAHASGLELLTEQERNPMYTNTYGTGLQIKHAIEMGAERVYLGIGGSATNDGGTGLAHALGYRFFDESGNEIKPTGSALHSISKITKPKISYNDVRFYAVNDVLNPLYGISGAAYTYARQKGANNHEIEQLNKGLEHLDGLIKMQWQVDESETPGSGAAGGTAYGLKCFFDAEFISGASFILGLSNFESLVNNEKIGLIITGEGKIDHQTAYGKFIFGIAQEAKQFKIPVIAVCGKLDATPSEIKNIGLEIAAEIHDPSQPAYYSYTNAARLITKKTAELLRELER
jgi:glycerate kinase